MDLFDRLRMQAAMQCRSFRSVVCDLPDIDAVEEDGTTLLLQACWSGRDASIMVVLEEGADVSAAGELYGSHSSPRILKLLCDYGTDVFQWWDHDCDSLCSHKDASDWQWEEQERRRNTMRVLLSIDGLPRGLGWRVCEWVLRC